MKTQESRPSREAAAVVANPVSSHDDAHRSVTQRVASSAHDTIDSAAAKAEELEGQLRSGASKAGTKLDASADAATEQAEKSLAQLESFVRGRPIAAAGIAFAAGVLATSLLRR